MVQTRMKFVNFDFDKNSFVTNMATDSIVPEQFQQNNGILKVRLCRVCEVQHPFQRTLVMKTHCSGLFNEGWAISDSFGV